MKFFFFFTVSRRSWTWSYARFVQHYSDERNRTVKKSNNGFIHLYFSLTLSSIGSRIYQDIGTSSEMKCIMGNTGNISFCPLSLFLWGTASPYLHNGAQRVEDGKGGVKY